MASFNQVTLVGNMVRDPEVKALNSGTSVAKFTIGMTRKWQTENGEKKEEATFVDVDSFGKTAAVIEKYLRKGDPVLVEGRLKTEQWEKDGQKRSKLMVVANSIQLLGKPVDTGARQPIQGSSPAAAPAPQPVAQDDVPF
jgi:single-strand DNA-binding protein